MTIINFTPFTALAGGALIGLAAGLLFHFKGRIAGISGVFGGILVPTKGDTLWRILFISGVVFGGFIWMLMGKSVGMDVANIQPEANHVWIIVAGLVVGVGTTLGSGCTSGHGICGIARFSPRSIVATITFMATGFIAVFIIRHLLGV
jgi:uncharacterized membrane protein YedE/YeeE